MKRTFSVLGLLSIAVVAHAGDKVLYKLAGVFTETCACGIPCKCELTGEVFSNCQGVGVFKITSGSYAGADLSGVTIAYAVKPGEWVRAYIDAPDKSRRDAAEKFARAVYKDWGTMEAVKDAKIAIQGTNGNYTVSVDGGTIMSYTIEPVLGGDGKTALTHGNTHNALTSTFYQAKSKSMAYRDDTRTIELASGRNGYFNDRMEKSGQL